MLFGVELQSYPPYEQSEAEACEFAHGERSGLACGVHQFHTCVKHRLLEFSKKSAEECCGALADRAVIK